MTIAMQVSSNDRYNSEEGLGSEVIVDSTRRRPPVKPLISSAAPGVYDPVVKTAQKPQTS